MSSVEIIEITPDQIDAFVDLPYLLYRKDPFWVPDLKKNVRHLLSLSHPFWQHASRKLFMAKKNGQFVGRIAAIINKAHNTCHNERCGFFGFFETINDKEVSSALITAAKTWLKKHNMETMRGPMNPSTNESCGLLISGFDSYPMIMMPYNPPYYVEHLESCGFEKTKDLLAFIRFTDAKMSPRIERIIRRLEIQPTIRPRKLRTAALEHEMSLVRDIYNDAWSENWGFVPMTREEMALTGKLLSPVLKPEHGCIIEIANEPAAFSLIFPDINCALRGTDGSINFLNIIPFLIEMGRIKQGRLLTLGVKKKFRNRGLELVLIKKVIDTCKQLGWTHGELSWVLEDNKKIIDIILEVGGRVYKKYRVYEMSLENTLPIPPTIFQPPF